MRKLIVLVLSLAASSLSFGQAIWLGTASISTSIYLNGSGTSAGSHSVNVSATGGFLGGPLTGQASFSGGSFDPYYYEFNFANGDATSLSQNSGGNLRLYINNQSGSSLSIPNNTLKFTLLFPAATTGTVTGLSLVSDTYSILGDFSVTSNGAGLLTLSQTSAITTGGNAENLELNFTTTAVPEPSTYAALVGLIALGATVIVRRRQRTAVKSVA